MFIGTKELFDGVYKNEDGLLLVAGEKGKTNPMTIGWVSTGIIWRRPVLVILVRHNRFTYSLMNNKEWAVCIPKDGEYKKELAICGSKSGRDIDKFKECGFIREDAHKINVDIPNMHGIIYECKTIYENDMDPNLLDEEIERTVYNIDRNHHKIFFGEILDMYEK